MLTGLEVVVAARGAGIGRHDRDGGRVRVTSISTVVGTVGSVAALLQLATNKNMTDRDVPHVPVVFCSPS